MPMPEEKDAQITRRTVIASATLVPVAALTAKAQAPETALSAPRLHTLEAFVDRLVPKDELGPGAVECGAANYINVQLAGYLAPEKANFLEGLAGVDAFARGKYDAPFADLSPEKRDELLTAMDTGEAPNFPNARAFFNRVRRLTLEGMFGDPHYGGNKNFAGWDLIQYPGPRLATTAEMQKMGVKVEPFHRSAWGAEHNGH